MSQSTSAAATPTAPPAGVKARQQAMWASGDFAVIGTTLQIVGEMLAEAADVNGGERVLDVAAGNGNATLAAARRFAQVTSTDYVPALLDRGKARAEADRLAVTFQEADAEALPFADASFDKVLSTYGVMFAPDHAQSARELLRVCTPGGKIGLACWTPAGFIGEVFRTTAKHVPPMAGVASPLLWGTDAHLAMLFAGASRIESTKRLFNFRYESPEHFLEMFRNYYGPTHKAFAGLPPEGQAALEADLLALLHRTNVSATAFVGPAEYLETVITK